MFHYPTWALKQRFTQEFKLSILADELDIKLPGETFINIDTESKIARSASWVD